MTSLESKEWAIPIRFESVELSPLAIVIDHLGMHENLPGLSEEASLWLWRFTICRGRYRTDSTENILKVTKEVMQLITENRLHLLESMPKRFDGPFTHEHLDLWISDLENIRNLCQGKEECTWECD